jgi:hypothetical protein
MLTHPSPAKRFRVCFKPGCRPQEGAEHGDISADEFASSGRRRRVWRPLQQALKLHFVLSPVIFVLWMSGCASTDTVSTKEPDLTKRPSVTSKPPIIFDKPMVRVRRAALEVLGSLNCIMKTEANTYLKGKCITGENIEIFFQSAAPNETHLWVETHFTYVGLLGQRNRNEEIIREIRRTLAMELAPSP